MKTPTQFFRDRKYRKAEMVSYWKHKDHVEAKVMRQPDGTYVMKMEGEKYLFPGYPRGSLLYGGLSPLKHQIKNHIFNDVWAMLEMGADRASIVKHLNTVAWPAIYELAEKTRYDMVPYERMNGPVKELYRAMEVVGVDPTLKEIICFILQEDDAYRMRLQWMVKFFPRWRKPTREDFAKALEMAEEAEVVGDMKERQRLFRRVFLEIADKKFDHLLAEVNWKKVALSKGDKYFFRAKYFKVDYPEYAY